MSGLLKEASAAGQRRTQVRANIAESDDLVPVRIKSSFQGFPINSYVYKACQYGDLRYYNTAFESHSFYWVFC